MCQSYARAVCAVRISILHDLLWVIHTSGVARFDRGSQWRERAFSDARVLKTNCGDVCATLWSFSHRPSDAFVRRSVAWKATFFSCAGDTLLSCVATVTESNHSLSGFAVRIAITDLFCESHFMV